MKQGLDKNVDILGTFKRKYLWYFEKKCNMMILMKSHRLMEDKVFQSSGINKDSTPKASKLNL